MTKIASGIVVVVAGAAGFLAGKSIPTGSDVAAEPPETQPKRAPLRIRLEKDGSKGKRDWADVFELGAAAHGTNDWVDLLHDARRDPFQMEAIVRRWAKQDPAACWEHIVTLGDGTLPPDHLADIAAREWGKVDPEQAIATLAEVTPAKYVKPRQSLAWIVIRAALEEDLDRGMALMPLPFGGGAFSWGRVEPWMKQDPEKACRALAALPQNCLFRNTLGAAAREWYRRDPQAALEWCSGLPADLERIAFDKIADVLVAAGDYDAANDLILSVESMGARQRIAGSYVMHLRRTDPEAACEWALENFDGRMLGATIGNIAKNVDFKKYPPETFLKYFDRVPEGNAKSNSARHFIRKWMQTDGLAAIAWGESLDPRTRVDALSGYAVKDWAKHKDSRKWLKTSADTRFSQHVLQQIVEDINDPEKAREFAATLPAEKAAQVEEKLEKMTDGSR